MDRIIDIIQSCNRFVITSHIRLDGDALGSELALYHALSNMGKAVAVCNQDATPEVYEFLPGSDQIAQTIPPQEAATYGAAFVLDCSSLERAGEMAIHVSNIEKIINIDHHVSNSFFSTFSLVDSKASSTGEILYLLFEKMGCPITKEIATNLYTAIMTDTGSFRYSNTGSKTLFIAAQLVAKGADPSVIAEQVYERVPPAKIKLLQMALQTLSVDRQKKVGSMYITKLMVSDAGALPEYSDGLVEVVRSIDGIDIALFFHEISDQVFKISLRSKGMIDVDIIARHFGGGGHRNAAACSIEGEIHTVRKKILNFIDMAM